MRTLTILLVLLGFVVLMASCSSKRVCAAYPQQQRPRGGPGTGYQQTFFLKWIKKP